MTRPASLRRLALCLLLAAPAVLAQASSGDRMRITTTMEMPGMNMSMPGQTQTMCTAKSQQATRDMVPVDKNCEVLDYQATANKASFRMRCTGESAAEGRGEFERLADGYRGMIDMTTEGQRMIMRFDGKRIGDCDYAKEGPEAQGRAMMAQSCAQMLRTAGYPYLLRESFVGPNATCASDKAKWCAKVTPLANDPKALREAMDSEEHMRRNNMPTHLWESLAACGLPRTTVLAKTCDRAQAAGDFGTVGYFCPERIPQLCPKATAQQHPSFLARHCPTQAQAIAAQHCVKRGFTVVITAGYGDFCNAMSAERLRGRGDAGGDAPQGGQDRPGQQAPAQESPPKPEEKKKPSWRDRLRDAIG